MGKDNPTTIKQRVRERLFHEQKGCCYYCGKPMLIGKGGPGYWLPHNFCTVDHIIPIAKGGARGATLNAVAACHRCNNQRGTKDARLFMLEKQGLA